MKLVKSLGKFLLSLVGLILLLILTINMVGTRSDIVAGVNGDKIKQIKHGMTMEQVISILGRPYKIDASEGLHNLGCKKPRLRLDMDINPSTDIKAIVDSMYSDTNYCCEGNKEDMQQKELTLTYTRPLIFCKNYPMLWVHLDSSYKVYSVYAKSYDGILGMDDPGIYGLTWRYDPSALEMKHDTIERFLNEELFNKSFH